MQLPSSFSGVVPSLAQVADFGPPRSEIGIGCLMPWLGRLYVLSYSSHRRPTGTGTGLRVIDGDFTMTRHPSAVDGTYANRYVHAPSSQLIIGPHVIDTQHRVRTVETLVDVRLCGTATHLTDPDRLVYMLGMEGELFELDVHTLETRLLFDLTRTLGTPGEGSCHFKDCYTGCGRLVVVNNDYHEPDFLGTRREGTLAEFNGSDWRVIERKPFVAVNGLGWYGKTIFRAGGEVGKRHPVGATDLTPTFPIGTFHRDRRRADALAKATSQPERLPCRQTCSCRARLHPLERKMPFAQPVEHLQLFQPRQRAQAAAFRFLGLDDVLKIGIHGWRKRFSNFAHASGSEWRARMSCRRSMSAIPASTNMTYRA